MIVGIYARIQRAYNASGVGKPSGVTNALAKLATVNAYEMPIGLPRGEAHIPVNGPGWPGDGNVAAWIAAQTVARGGNTGALRAAVGDARSQATDDLRAAYDDAAKRTVLDGDNLDHGVTGLLPLLSAALETWLTTALGAKDVFDRISEVYDAVGIERSVASDYVLFGRPDESVAPHAQLSGWYRDNAYAHYLAAFFGGDNPAGSIPEDSFDLAARLTDYALPTAQ